MSSILSRRGCGGGVAEVGVKRGSLMPVSIIESPTDSVHREHLTDE